MNPRFVVFVCSTYADLIDEREAVLDAVRRVQLQHDSMEFFGARADRSIETSLSEVRNSDILVVIVGHRYGSLVPEMDISYSEAEYNEGHQLGKPSLVYMRSKSVPVPPDNIERDPDKIRLLDMWKSKLRERHTVASFESSEDLAVQAAADLGRQISLFSTAYDSGIENVHASPVLALLDSLSAWLGGVEKFIAVLGDTLNSVAIGSPDPLIYDLEERGELASFMSENTNEILGIVESDALITERDKESGLELSELVKEIDQLVKYRLLPLDHEILDRARLGNLSEAFVREVGEFKLTLESKVRRANSLLANIRTSLN